MTKRPSLDEFLSHRKDYVDENGVLYKGAVTMEKRYDEEKRTARFIMSSEASDRMSDVVKQEGIDLSNFLKNPIGLAYHRHDSPIGVWKNVEVVTNARPARTEGDLHLHAEGTTEMSDEIGRLLSVGGLKAVSIGFIPKEVDWIRDDDGVRTGGFRIPECELIECSVVSIPAQPVALMKAANGNAPLVAEALEYILDTYCEKTAGGLFVRKEFEQAYLEMKKTTERSTPMRTMERELSVAIDLDLQEAEKKVDGLLDRLRKGMAEVFGGPVTEKSGEVGTPVNIINYTDSPITVEKKDDGTVYVVGKWPEKSSASIEFLEKDCGWEMPQEKEGGLPVEIKTADQIAIYKAVGLSDENTVNLELVEVKDIEPEPVAPVLVKGSRAQADARIAAMKAKLTASGALS